MENKKVYCQGCYHCKRGQYGVIGCYHPDNLQGDYYAPNSSLILEMAEKNKNNDCADFVDNIMKREEEIDKERVKKEMLKLEELREKKKYKMKWYLPWWLQ